MWNTFHSSAKVEECVRLSLKNLQLEYLDLCLIHWPLGYKVSQRTLLKFLFLKSAMHSGLLFRNKEDGELFPKDADGKFLYSDVDYLDTWKGLEHVVNLGLVKSIGLSNFNSQQVKRILENGTIKPVMNQVRFGILK